MVVWSILFWTAVAFGFRLLYLLKIAFVAGAEDGFSNGNGSEKPPLESQRKATGNLLAASAADVDMPGYRIVALRGPWGSGKSTIVRNFVTEASRKNIVVEIQAWEHEAEADLEIAIMRGLTRSWRVIWPFGWVTIPVISIALRKLPLAIKTTLKMPGDVEVAHALDNANAPPVVWSWLLRRLVRGVRRAGANRLILVIDDVDRCSPPVAQRFMTLSRRLLDIPYVTVVLPYVEDQLRAKVFDPFRVVLPDLAGTTEAMLQYEIRATEEWDKLSSALDPLPPARLAPWLTPQGAAPAPSSTPATQSPAAATQDKDKPKGPSEPAGAASFSDAANPFLASERLGLLRFYQLLSPRNQAAILKTSESKYIGDHVVVVPELTAYDIIAIIVRKASFISGIYKKPEFDELIKSNNQTAILISKIQNNGYDNEKSYALIKAISIAIESLREKGNFKLNARQISEETDYKVDLLLTCASGYEIFVDTNIFDVIFILIHTIIISARDKQTINQSRLFK